MARTVSIGAQSFEDLRENGYFYVDKTGFIPEWWRSGDAVTLICRPRRFGKTLMLSTVESFLSPRNVGRGEGLFDGLRVWEDADMRMLNATVPVVMVSFAKVKEVRFAGALSMLKRVLRVAVESHGYLRTSDALDVGDHAFLMNVRDDMSDDVAADSLGQLCSMLEKHWGVRPVVLLDEYDTPMQEAWLHGYWDDMADFMRALFNATFKTNSALGRGLVTGTTRIAQESIFSDMNNPRVVTTTSRGYETSFGFTQSEVLAALEEFGLDEYDSVRDWYDGFTFGDCASVYNPWSITQYLKNRALGAYWVNTSSNALASSLVREGDERLKSDFEALLQGGTIVKPVDEQVAFSQLDGNSDAVWSLLVASGYVRAEDVRIEEGVPVCNLRLTNREVLVGFSRLVEGWFSSQSNAYNEFCRAVLAGDVRAMNAYLSDVALACMSSFDSASHPSERSQPERFYHGLVLGMLVELRGRYAVESNRESGFGRYDVMLVPNDGASGDDPAVILEFKVFDREWDGEQTLADTVARAHEQIEEKGYAKALVERGISAERIQSYGIAFRGKEVLVG